jgi:hypothetical protein
LLRLPEGPIFGSPGDFDEQWRATHNGTASRMFHQLGAAAVTAYILALQVADTTVGVRSARLLSVCLSVSQSVSHSVCALLLAVHRPVHDFLFSRARGVVDVRRRLGAK